MAEYWKSTPKYWCKHCSTYVKDTPFERKQHESTGKHQGNLKRFLRDIQNTHERSEREKERAKSEVERLSKVAGGNNPTSSSATATTSKSQPVTVSKPATPAAADLKRQWAQLAEMGIKVPEQVRSEMAMPGEWTTVEQKTVNEVPADEARNIGVRKRKHEDQEEEEDEAEETIVNGGWGSSTRRYPGDDRRGLEELLSGTISLKKEKNRSVSPRMKDESAVSKQEDNVGLDRGDDGSEEQKSNPLKASSNDNTPQVEPLVKGEVDLAQPSDSLKTIPEEVPLPVFKRRKAKAS